MLGLSLVHEERDLLGKITHVVTAVRLSVKEDPSSVEVGIQTLRRLRRENYEELNQVQHEAMILRAARFLEARDNSRLSPDWYWNPRQTGAADEPDLRGIIGSRIVISAEITTSERPIGTIDRRMATTLGNLSRMCGRRLYFVRSESMRRRAQTKVDKAGYDIEVQLDLG